MIECTNTHLWLFENAQNRPSSPAVITEDRIITYRELCREVMNSASYFSFSGISKNENVGILYRHNYGLYAIVNALWRIGAVPVPLNTRLTESELSIQIENAGIKFLIVDEYYSDIADSLDISQKIVYSHNYKSEEPAPSGSSFNISHPALIVYTSGSSGRPKAAVHTFSSLYESVKLADSFSHFEPRDVLLASLPLYHVGGFMMLMRALLSGAAVAFPESLHNDDLTEAIGNFNPTILSLVPTMLLRLNEISFKPNKALRLAYLGGGPAADELVIKSLEKGLPVVKVYGSTETCSMVTALLPDDVKRTPSSSGRPMQGVEIKITNEELFIKSPSLFKEYYNNPVDTNEKLSHGFYKTEDFAYLDQEGFLFIDARREDIIITGGENVSVKEIETTLKQHELVEDVAVFPVSDPVWGQIVCAAVVLKEKDAVTEDDIRNYLEGLISSYKIPRTILFLHSIPRTEMGKTRREELIEIVKNLRA